MDGSIDVGSWNPHGDETGLWNFYGEDLSKFLHGSGFDCFDACSVRLLRFRALCITFFFFVFFLLRFLIK